jgi:hypothetical protein
MPKGKHNVRKVKFSAAEMSYEPPAEVDFSSGLVFRGLKGWKIYREWRRKVAMLDPEVRKAFPNDRSVNDALRKLIESSHEGRTGRRKSA